MNHIDNQEIIKKYVDGTMSTAEKQVFEQNLATDTTLQKEVDIYRQLHFALNNQDLLSVSKTIGAVIGKTTLTPDFDAYQTQFSPPSVSDGKSEQWWTNKKIWFLGTFALVLLASIGFYALKNASEYTRNQAIVAQFQPFNNIVGLNPDDPSPFAQAMRLYDAGDFSGAKTILVPYVQRTHDPMAQLYLGITQLMTHDNEKAIATLRLSEQNPDVFTQEPARYNLALALLKVGKRQEAADILRGLLTHPVYGEKAQAIVRELK